MHPMLLVAALVLSAGPDKDLFDAVDKGDAGKAAAAIAKGANVDAQASDGSTPLMIAAAGNFTGLAQLLLQKGAKVGLADHEGVTALHVAIDRGNQGFAQLLLAKGADVNAKEKNGRSPLIIAADRGKAPVVKLLLDNKADPNVKATDGRTALIHAINNENFDVVKMLIDKGADVSAADTSGHTPLSLAARGCQPDPQELIGEQSQRPGHSKTCAKQMLATIKLLLDKGASVNARGSDGLTPILTAMGNNQKDIAKLLMEKKPDLTGTVQGKRTALMIAAGMGYTEVLKLMLDAGTSDLNAKDIEGNTALKWATENGHRDCADLLRKAGAKE